MVIERRFCSICGKPVGSADNFCGSCGSPLKAPAAPPTDPVPTPAFSSPAPPPQPLPPVINTGETVLGVIPASHKTGMFSQEGMHIIVTGSRLICAAFTNEMVKQAAKEEGKSGFLSGMIGAATIGYTYYKRYLTMAPDLALKENPQNFCLERGNLRRVKLELGKRQIDRSRNVDVYQPGKLEIESHSEKYTFSVPHNFHEMASRILRQAGLI